MHPPQLIKMSLKKNKMAKNKPLAENVWYEWYDWLINHISVTVKKSTASHAKEKIMELFETKIEKDTPNNIPKDYKPKMIVGVFDDISSTGVKMSSI